MTQNWFMAGSHPADYELGIDPSTTFENKPTGFIKSKKARPGGFGTMMQMFKADNYRGKRMRISAFVKSEGITSWAGLWMRVDGPEQGKHLAFDNMGNRPIKGTTGWQKYEIILDVAANATFVAFGILLTGKGQAWLSQFTFEEVGPAVATTSLDKEREYPDHPFNLDFAEAIA